MRVLDWLFEGANIPDSHQITSLYNFQLFTYVNKYVKK